MDASYDTMAEFHEVYMPPSWDRLRNLVSDTFGDIGPEGVIADIGAGSGLGSVLLANVSDAEIIALEPNTTMRSMMVARLDTVGVLERVTILPGAVPEGLEGLPEDVDGIVAAHMLELLTKAAQNSLLDWAAASLAPGRSALLTVTPEAMQQVPAEGTEPVVAERTVGRFVYRMTHRMSDPGGIEAIWEVIDRQGRVVRSVTDAASWEPMPVAEVRAALAGRPVEVTEPLPAVVLISKLSE